MMFSAQSGICRKLGNNLPLGILVLTLGLSGAAQPVGPTFPDLAPQSRQGADGDAQDAPAPGHETELQTIAKCLQDMASADVKLRRRAVLILGKYRAAAAQAAVVKALADPDATVRQSALVSISEQAVIPPEARDAVLKLLGDPDVHIRRIASSMLDEVIATPLAVAAAFARNRNGPPVALPPGAATKQQVDAIGAALNEALDDEDAVVRKNVLAVARMLPEGLDPDRLARCFRDPDKDVRILALQAFRRLPGGETARAGALQPLVTDPDPLVRRETARTLGRFGAAATPYLRTLAEDPAADVRLEAVRQLAQQQDAEGYDRLLDTVLDRTQPADERASLMPMFLAYRDRAEAALKQVLEQGDGAVQAGALKVLASVPGEGTPVSMFLPYLSDDSRELRQAAVYAVSRRRMELQPRMVRSFLDSRYDDVRELAVALADTPGRLAADRHTSTGRLADHTGAVA
jgi:HEAT repeat protein